MSASPPSNQISGRSAFVELLKAEGVTQIFGNPGTTELPIMHALTDHPDMGYVLGLQEAIVVAMADGYARASGRLAACNVHVAPGLGNAIGALYNAHVSGTPLIVTAGQQEQGHGLMEPLLYAPLVPIAAPVVKWATEVTRLADLPRLVHRAAKVALTPPTGPVFISLPGDILNDFAPLELGEPTRVDAAVRPSDGGAPAARRAAAGGAAAGDPRRQRDRHQRRLRRGGALRRGARRPGLSADRGERRPFPLRASPVPRPAVARSAARARAAEPL